MPDRRPSVPRPLVLIADDNSDAREMYAVFLEMSGYRVETAGDGREAVVKALALRPEVIVLDLHMPGVDGWRAMQEIRDNAKIATTPIIVLTGHDLKDYLKPAALTLGACSYLMKPCLPERLAREIAERLAARPARIATAL